MKNNTLSLTPDAARLFALYVQDAGNWGGTPLVGGNVILLGLKEDRGLLTALKRARLLTTFISDGEAWVSFTDAGKAYATSLGLNGAEGL